MQLLLLCVSLTILCSAAEEKSEPYYVVTVPGRLTYPSEDKACVVFEHLTGAVNFKLELHEVDTDRVEPLVDEKIEGHDFSQCYTFHVPSVSNHYNSWHFHMYAEGENLKVNDTKHVAIFKLSDTSFIQTDKPIYKPGQTVQFRVVTLNENFQILKEKLPLVTITNPSKSIIAQWLDVSPVQGIADFSFHLADELALGEYRINIPRQAHKTFSVSEYELKKFELDFHIPNTVSRKADEFTLDVCGRYTFGKPVKGSVEIYVCKNYVIPFDDDEIDDEERNDCHHISDAKTDEKGCVTKKINLDSFNLTEYTYVSRLTVSAAFKEHHTGHVERGFKSLQIGSPDLIKFTGFDFFYHKGIPYTGTLTVVNVDKQPKANENVFIIVNNGDERTNISLVTDDKGLAHFSLDTSEWKETVMIHGAFHLEDDEENDHYTMAGRMLFPFYTASNSFFKVENIANKLTCNVKQPVKVEYSIDKNDLNPNSNELTIFYLISSKGRIVTGGEHNLDVKGESSDSNLHGFFSLNIEPTISFFPEVQLLVFTILKNGAITADKSTYRVSASYKNKVKLQFSEKEVNPRGKVNLDITAESGSMCSVRSVDKGLLLHQSHESLLPDIEAFEHEGGMFYWQWAYGRTYEQRDACQQNTTTHDRYYSPHEAFEVDVESLFQTSFLSIFTNTKIHRPQICSDLDFNPRGSEGRAGLARTSPPRPKEPKKTIERKVLPESWIYDLVGVGPEGHTQISLTTPDSITTWETDAFCLSQSGYGEAEKVELTTIQSYFIDLTFPHSVVQDEVFPLTAQVFNYEKTCLVVGVWLSDSPDFKAVKTYNEDNHCICADQSEIYTWNVTAKTIGKIKLKVSSGAHKLEGACPSDHLDLGEKEIEDSLEKTIIVKPSGVEEDKTETYRLCPEGGSARQEISLKVPDNRVAGSEHAYISVFGDILNNAAENFENIFGLPTGCGEQNMAKFAASLYLYLYLNHTKQLKPEMTDKLLKALVVGYQKQMEFKHEDGSYIVFPGDKGNIWLTASVVRYFSEAQKIIHTEDKNIEDSVKYLKSVQLPSGCFQQDIPYFNVFLEDDEEHKDEDEDIQLTAYVVISLKESGRTFEDGLVDNALSCLKKKAHNVTNTFTESLLAYVFTLSKDEDLRQDLLEDLEKKAIKTEISLHWKIENSYSGNVEISSYVALAYIEHHATSKDTAKDNEKATQIINWMINEQSSYGGYYSTRDTVTALHAISDYAAHTVIGTGDVSVTVRSPSGFMKQFTVDQAHNQLLQKASLPDIPGEYTVTATGGSCVYVQAHLEYHVPVVKEEDYFALTVSTQPPVCSYQALTNFEIVIEASYTGKRPSSNMAIIEVELLSGFVPDKKSVNKLLNSPHVKRTEISEDKVTIYLNGITHEKQTLSFITKQETHVDNLHPATVLVYDYYEPEHHAVVEFNSPCHKAYGHCPSDVSHRKNCGHPTINSEECLQRHCCYDTSVPQVPWCFFREF
ncbi:alpha-2-macroglobulin-like protein 1 [Pelobates fuscus]|uniref:alpha-2-macroglobulin-like protein 1 n=1 Tax=Pelobates fuscus TaxID=191477 RepID=UPI002FE4A4F2